LQLYTSPSEEDVSTLEQVVSSWFIVGKLGGYNSMNLQVCAPPLSTTALEHVKNAAEAIYEKHLLDIMSHLYMHRCRETVRYMSLWS
jgi:hypothetical protein